MDWEIRGHRERSRGGLYRHRSVPAGRVAKRPGARVEAGRDGTNDNQRDAERSGLGRDDDARLEREGRTYRVAPGTRVRILPRDVPEAIEASLRFKGRQRTETQRFITDRFDRFLFVVSQLQIAVRSGLVPHEDVKFPLNWYVEKRLCGHKKLLLEYIAENSVPESKQFFESLDAWQRCPSD